MAVTSAGPGGDEVVEAAEFVHELHAVLRLQPLVLAVKTLKDIGGGYPRQ